VPVGQGVDGGPEPLDDLVPRLRPGADRQAPGEPGEEGPPRLGVGLRSAGEVAERELLDPVDHGRGQTELGGHDLPRLDGSVEAAGEDRSRPLVA